MNKRQAKKAARNVSETNTYAGYLNKYKAEKRYLADRGFNIPQTPLTEREWEARYKAFYNTRKREIAKGKRKNIGDINKKIVDEQYYFLSDKQAESLMDFLRQTAPNKHFTLTEIKLDVYGFTDPASGLVAMEGRKLREMGLSSKETSILIGQRFFGSV